MFTTGSKLLIGASVLSALAAVVYGLTQDGVQGTIGLVSAAVALAGLAGVDIWARDSNLSADDAVVVATSDAARLHAGRSLWPLLFGVGAVTLVLGLVSQQSVFVIGLVVLLAAGAEWAVQAWAEAASDDADLNERVRSRLAGPLEFPLLGAIAIGGIAYSFSRVMLWLSKTNTVVAFAVLAAIVALIGFAFAMRPSVKRGAVGGALALGAVAVVAGGVAAGVDGERDIHVHETTGGEYAAEVCTSAEETEADEKASQTVAAKANAAATITLTAAGTLEFDVPGPVESGATQLSLPRSNPSNIIFRNEHEGERRLTLDVGPVPESLDPEGGEGERSLVCTALVEEGGAQLLTVTLGAPSIAFAGDDEAYRFTVPGVDSAELGLFVP